MSRRVMQASVMLFNIVTDEIQRRMTEEQESRLPKIMVYADEKFIIKEK
jgi:hypothetical protein